MPHAVVLDLALPRLGGREVLKELRANAATHKIPVIVVTGTDHGNVQPERDIPPACYPSVIFGCLERGGQPWGQQAIAEDLVPPGSV